MKAYFRGEIGAILALVILLATRVVTWPIVENFAKSHLTWPVLILSGILFLGCAIAAIRAADRLLYDGDRQIYTLSIAVTFVVAIVTFEQSIRVATRGDPLPQTGTPTDLPESIVANSSAILLDGPIDFEMYKAVKLAIANNPPERMELSSDGGLINAARGIARLVEETGVSTHAIGPCRSACTLIFVAGKSRTIGPEGLLGFHAYGHDVGDVVGQIKMGDPSEALQRDLEWMRGRGVSEDFTRRVSQVPHSEMWHPSQAELIAANVMTGRH